MSWTLTEYVIKDKDELSYAAKDVLERNTTSLFLTELFRGMILSISSDAIIKKQRGQSFCLITVDA